VSDFSRSCYFTKDVPSHLLFLVTNTLTMNGIHFSQIKNPHFWMGTN